MLSEAVKQVKLQGYFNIWEVLLRTLLQDTNFAHYSLVSIPNAFASFTLRASFSWRLIS